MDPPSKPSNSLFEVYLRLRPSFTPDAERFLDVEAREDYPKHITIKPPAGDHRKRAVERFAFTRVFQEGASQLDVFKDTGVLQLVEGVLGTDRREGRDGLLATLGVTGSGKVWIAMIKPARVLSSVLTSLIRATPFWVQKLSVVSPNCHSMCSTKALQITSSARHASPLPFRPYLHRMFPKLKSSLHLSF
jgi:hypothetical protein